MLILDPVARFIVLPLRIVFVVYSSRPNLPVNNASLTPGRDTGDPTISFLFYASLPFSRSSIRNDVRNWK